MLCPKKCTMICRNKVCYKAVLEAVRCMYSMYYIYVRRKRPKGLQIIHGHGLQALR